jgi:hypothetical protein
VRVPSFASNLVEAMTRARETAEEFGAEIARLMGVHNVSTVRRSFAAFLGDSVSLKARPRDPDQPEQSSD